MNELTLKLKEDKFGYTWFENRNGDCWGLTAIQLRDYDLSSTHSRINISICGKSKKWLVGGLSIFKTDFIKMCKEFLELNGYEVKKK